MKRFIEDYPLDPDSGHYILNDQGEPEICLSLQRWGEFYSHPENRIIHQTQVGSILISTVFLGLDHRFGDGPPILWETMMFGWMLPAALQHYQERYTSRDHAEAGHWKAYAAVKCQPMWRLALAYGCGAFDWVLRRCRIAYSTEGLLRRLRITALCKRIARKQRDAVNTNNSTERQI